MKAFTSGMIAGCAVLMLCESAHQDMLGRDAYLTAAREHWLTGWANALGYIFYAGIFIVMLGAELLRRVNKKRAKASRKMRAARRGWDDTTKGGA